MTLCKSKIETIKSVKDFLHVFRQNCEQKLYIDSARVGNLEFMKILEDEFDWDIKEMDSEDSDAYQYAIEGGHLHVLQYLEETGSEDSDAYQCAAEGGHLHVLQYLEEKHNWDIYTKDENGANPYMIAANFGHLDLMKYFESKNYEIYQVDKDGWDAYIYAASGGHVHIMKHLEDTHNWNIHVRGSDGKSAFTFVSLSDKHENVREHLNKKILDENFTIKNNPVATNTCHICEKKFKNNDIYLKCTKGHMIHKKCYIDVKKENCKYDVAYDEKTQKYKPTNPWLCYNQCTVLMIEKTFKFNNKKKQLRVGRLKSNEKFKSILERFYK